ncbi:MAG: putative aminohydrolase SsnA [Anaerolineales bacterium]|jgi:putative selenium metabolism protein SsnA|nr:putative aminohydrolase SsnA [Anaerolineales bacterium]MDX9936776.1 putative aminohydrolase SsnA [Anaerolineales bacterium]GER81171.1 aminohydrolase SsnA [Candidatus Denitrolinea symbiosum]
MTTRFENGIVVTLGKNNRVLWNGSVVTDGENIIAVGAAAEMKQKYPDADSVDCSNKVVLPGFICAHHHFYSTLARGMAIPGEPASNFVEVLERLWWKVDRAIVGDDILLSAQIPLIESIRNGTTTIIDHHASPSASDGSLDIIESAVRQAGVRASLCYEVSDRNVHGEGIRENERFIKKVGKGDGQIAAMMGLHASFTVADDTVEKCVGIARDAGVGCHIHVAEDAADRQDSLEKYGVPTVKRLDRLNVTGEKSIFVHCVHIDEEEMDIVADTRTSIVHNPESNMNNAVGVTQILKMLGKGILVGLGTDGMNSDMLTQMRAAYLLHRLDNRDPRVAFTEAPQLLLQNNADLAERQFGIRLGELAEGRPADMAILDYIPPTPMDESNFLGHLIFGMTDSVVDTTVCRGKILMRNKQILTMDEERLAARARELAPQVWKRLQAL